MGDPSTAEASATLRHRGGGANTGEDTNDHQSSASSSDNSKALIPPASWTFNKNGVPQCIAHRGYKASFPENTMGAFRGAVEVGAHAIETDLHLSRDGVVVIAHDKDLKRCYGVDALVSECTWEHLSTLKTLREPRQPMPRLSDLLAYLSQPAQSGVWLLLDIKLDDAAEVMIPLLAETLTSASSSSNSSSSSTTWAHRVVLGCWTARHVALCRAHLPAFAVAWIGVTLPLAREYLRVPNVALNMRQEPLFAAGGAKFIAEVRADGRPLFAWTVNSVAWMGWAIGVGLDAVITDDPRLFLEVCERHEKGKKKGGGLVDGVKGWLWALAIPLLVRWAGYYKRVGGPEVTREVLRKL